jgi:hypothetical protein
VSRYHSGRRANPAVVSLAVRARALLVILLALLVSGSVGAHPSGAAPTGNSLPLLTTIRAIRALSQDESSRGYPVRVRAIVTHIDERADVSLMIHDGELGQFVVPPANPATAGPWRELRRGDLIEIEGRTVRGGFAPNVEPLVIRRLGQAPLPQPKNIPFASMLTGRHDCDYVEVIGVVQRAWRSSDPSVHNLFMDVAFEEGVVRAAFWDFEPTDFDRLIDARVRLEGNVGSLFGRTEQLRGVSHSHPRRRDRLHSRSSGRGSRFHDDDDIPIHPQRALRRRWHRRRPD